MTHRRQDGFHAVPHADGTSSSRRSRAAGARPRPGRRSRLVAALAMAAGTLLAPVGPLATPPAGAAAAALSLRRVQSLYAQDLLARVNAERAARNSPAQPVPPLAVDPGLAAAAQAWSAHLAAVGQVQDPPLSACGPTRRPGQVCELAANTGDLGQRLLARRRLGRHGERLHGLGRPPAEHAERRLRRRSASG